MIHVHIADCFAILHRSRDALWCGHGVGLRRTNAVKVDDGVINEFSQARLTYWSLGLIGAALIVV